ncbi:hypothetical protein FSP39_013590 [Pinctada imbricata]|uniref:A disintegrin and metalloproteinase with thrombospondin motifs 18 n=1 Tax=Pinctada imbricata TaxID=66713 RepID=A0AA88XNL6_PINIB|nr:hypothetical protein FSP39_013590 [Pinctada imbricata]
MNSNCHFRSSFESKNSHTAALSLCDGVNGIIRTAEEDYIIEPYERHKITTGDEHFHERPHKLVKRSALKVDQNHYCGQSDRRKRSLTHIRNENELNNTSRDVDRRSQFKWRFQNALIEREERTVETLVVVDKTLYHKHGKDNITTYTLTLFNMVAELYRDPSLGNNINIVLVGLILLEGDEPGLSIAFHADNTLNSFCTWQSVLVGANGRQHDHAILLTGLDLCSYKNAPCDTLGFAPIEGMCNRVRSCTINEDTGLSTAFTIAHEMGHNFGMFHDGEGNYCTQSAGKIMSPTLVGKNGQFHWSICSKAYLMRFMNTPQSECLTDKPKKVAEIKFPDKLPGELYNADIQCKWQFGRRAKLCNYDFGKDICKSLWCYRGRKRCETKFLPAAEGTSCGNGMWCRKGQCVRFGQDGPSPIDGGWSQWSPWSECSRTCGGGVIHRERQCNNPLPQYGGNPCSGEEKVYKICNVQDCPRGEDDFYQVQCSSYNAKPFRGWYLKWRPHRKLYNAKEPCKLYCIAETYNYVFTIKHTATDGMKCDNDNSMCVDGVCKPIGCDWIVGSDALNDACGVCKGDNSTCRIIKGEYTEQPKHNTYFPVAILPKSARSIKVSEKRVSSNYIAIRDIFGHYYLNGQHRVGWPGEYMLGGARFIYKRPYNRPETLEGKGPLQEDLVLEVLVQDRNPGIQYEYALPISISNDADEKKEDTYTWSVSATPCSEPCAGGRHTIKAVCHRNLYEEVAPSNCDKDTKPRSGIFSCNAQPCPPRWVPEEWTECSRKCGGGKQRRKIFCRQRTSSSEDRRVRKRQCKGIPKPIKSRRCNPHLCPPRWKAGKWSKCSVSCGVGQQTRKVVCRARGGKRRSKVVSASQCKEDQPKTVRQCKEPRCAEDSYNWHLSEWGPCSKTCDRGLRHRYLQCHRESFRGRHFPTRNKYCRNIPHPNITMTESCLVMPCQSYKREPQWLTSEWTQCSVTCGEGEQRRKVTCVDTKGQSSSGCDLEERPPASKDCKLGNCPVNDHVVKEKCEDQHKWCHLVPEHNVCSHDFYGKQCCKSCQKQR